MIKWRRIVSLVLATVLSASLATGCSGGNKESSTTSGTTSTNEKEHLVWAVWDVSSTAYYQPLLDAYKEKNPNVEIELKDLGSTDYDTALSTQLAGGDSGIDIITIKDMPGYANIVNAGHLEDMTSYVQSAGIDTSAYNGIVEQISVDGKIYALPFRNDFWVIYYNKDIFDKAGVDYPTNDMTFKQYDELARKVTSGSGNDKIYGAHYHTWRSCVELFGILDGKHSVLDGDYSFMKDYYDIILKEQKDGICQNYSTLKTGNLHYSGVFENGKVAMMNMGSWFIATLMNDIKAGKSTVTNWGIVKYPHPEGVEAGTTFGTITSLSVAATSQHKETAEDFIKFVCGEEGAKILVGVGQFPALMNDEVRNEITKLEGFPTDDNSKEALNVTKQYLELPFSSNVGELDTALSNAHDAIMTESVSIDDGLKQMEDEAKSILGK